MKGTTMQPHRYVSKVIFASVVVVAMLLAGAPSAQAQSYLMPDNEAFAGVIEQLSNGDIDSAEKALDALPARDKNADYHYLRGVLSMQAMNDAGAFGMARLARRMKKHLEDALEADPDHAHAHFALMQFHRFAPGIMGGRERELEFHYQRLIDLNSFLQFPAALVKAQVEDNQSTQREIYQDWVTHSPQMFEAHYAYLSSLIGWGDYEQAQSAIEEALHHADGQQTQLVQYQQVRMAALAGLDEDAAAASAYRQQAWFTAAYAAGLELLALESRSAQVDEGWLEMRLAQIEWALADINSAERRVQRLLAEQPEERLEAQAIALQERFADSASITCPEPSGCA